MDMQFTGNPLADLAVVVGALVALSLALQTAAGPTLMYIAEAIKSAFNVPSGKGGIVAILTGIFMGVLFGILAALLVDDINTTAVVAAGGLAGMFMGAGAVQTHKAAGEVNPPKDGVAIAEISPDPAIYDEIDGIHRNVEDMASELSFLRSRIPSKAGMAAPMAQTLVHASKPVNVGQPLDMGVEPLLEAPSASQGKVAKNTLPGDLDDIIANGPGDDPEFCNCTPNHADPSHSHGPTVEKI